MSKIMNNISDKLDIIFAQLGIIFSLILLIYLHLKSYNLIYTVTAFLSLVSCLLWLGIRSKVSIMDYCNSTSKKSIQTVLLSIFLSLYSLHIILLVGRNIIYERPFSYFILIAILTGIIVLEIYFMKGNIYSYSILVQIILIGVSISWSQQLISPTIIGVDPWYHQHFTDQLIKSHYIPSGESYSKLPMFHLLIASTSIVTGLDYKLASMLSISLPLIVSNVLFIYLIGMYLYPQEHKIRYLAALFLIISNHYIFMTYWLIPNGFAAFFVFPLFYSSLSIKKSKNTIGTMLSILFAVMIIMTHALAAMYMAIALLVYWASNHIYHIICSEKSDIRKTVVVSLPFCALFAVVMLAWWTYLSGNLSALIQVLKGGVGENLFVRTPDYLISETNSNITLSEQLRNNIGMLVFFSLAFVGFLYANSRKNRSDESFCFAWVAITPLFIGYFSLLSNSSMIEHRWWYLSQLTLSIYVAISSIIITNTLKKNTIRPLLLAVGISLIAFFLIISPPANNDYHKFSSNSSMSYTLKMSELKTIETCSNIWDGQIKTDRYYAGTQSYNYNTSSFDKELFDYSNASLLSNSLVLVRESIENEPFMAFQSLVNPHIKLTSKFDSAHYSNIYSSGTVEGYLFFTS